MSDFLYYMWKQAERKEAYANYNHAGVKLENCHIYERLAEIKSQGAPINEIMNSGMNERQKLYAISHYVVMGRIPCREGVIE